MEIEKRGIGKKGMSHIELIVAILIFIFAVVTVIYLINFQSSEGDSQYFLNILEGKLRERAEISYAGIDLSIEQPVTGDCFSVNKPSFLIEQTNTIIKTDSISTGNEFIFSGDKILIANTGDFYKIYYFSSDVTDDFVLQSANCIDLVEREDYNYSIIYRDEIFAEQAFENLPDYEQLKQDFGLEGKDFSIRVQGINDNFSFILEKQKTALTEVQAKEFLVNVFMKDGRKINAILNLQIW